MQSVRAPVVRITSRPSPLPIAARYLDLSGELWEVGTYRGLHAVRLARLRRHPQTLRLFDTFGGRPEGTAEDGAAVARAVRFADTSLAHVRARLDAAGCLEHVAFHPGVVPASFVGLEAAQVAFAYVDLDLYTGTAGALAFILPRLVPGGAVLVDDVGTATWPGVTRAVEERPEPWTRVQGTRALFEREAAWTP